MYHLIVLLSLMFPLLCSLHLCLRLVQSCNLSVVYFVVVFTSNIQLSALHKFALRWFDGTFCVVDYVYNNVMQFCKAVF